MIKVLKFIFYLSVIFLIVISLWPGSLLGFLLYNDWGREPHIDELVLGIENSFYSRLGSSTINHFFYYLYVSLLGFYIYIKNENFKKLVYWLFFLSIISELFHLVIPNRAFQLVDLIANICGVTVAYFAIKIYLFIKNHE